MEAVRKFLARKNIVFSAKRYFIDAMGAMAQGLFCTLLVGTILNTLGTVDILPFTGVTFPFVSNGGTSMVASWGLLAFVKAVDTRQNASFAVKLTGKGKSK
mgnify:CR=1 FL=1